MKKFLMGLIAVVLAIGSLAFDELDNNKFTDYYFKYQLNSSTGLLTEGNWLEIPATENCGGTNFNCVIKLVNIPPVSGHANFAAAGIDTQPELDAVTQSRKNPM